jgi:predicted transposase/invertase (TIGR01784 family)
VDIVKGQHDEFFKALLEQPGAAGALLRERLPQEITALLAEGEPEAVKGSFVDDELSESHSDCLFRVQLAAGGHAYVYCLIEHKSDQDPRVALQLLRYMVRIWERLDGEAKSCGLLPPVIPLVVYHGADAWTGPVRFTQMLAASAAVKAQSLDFPFRVVDVGRIDDADLSRHRRLQAGLLVLKCVMLMKAQGRIEVLEHMLSSVADLPLEFIALVVRYTCTAYAPLDEKTLSEVLRRVMPGKEKQMLSIAARQWLAEGEAKGEARGEARGRAEGEVRGEAKALVRMLQKRFGRIPARYLQVIASATTDELESWIDRALDAPTIKAVFAQTAH